MWTEKLKRFTYYVYIIADNILWLIIFYIMLHSVGERAASVKNLTELRWLLKKTAPLILVFLN